MKTKRYFLHQRQGFTLLELLAVLAIIIALFAIIAPNILGYRTTSNIHIAKATIKNFEEGLDFFYTDHSYYPTTEQGLNALIFIPSNEMAGTPVTFGGNPIDPTMTPGTALGPAGAVSSLSPPGTAMTMDGGMVGTGGTAQGFSSSPSPNVPYGMQPGMPGTDTFGNQGMSPGMTPGMTDMSMTGGGATGFGSNPTAMSGVNNWTETTYNPLLYQPLRARSTNYFKRDKLPLDPWNMPFRYVNQLNGYGVNPYTGTEKPAIWSAGPDKKDGTPDDIPNWDPVNAASQLQQAQERSMQGANYYGNQGYPTPGNPTPGNPTPGYPTPGNPTPGYPTPGNLTPGYPTPGNPTPGYPTPGNPTPGYPTPGNPTPGYPTPGNPTPGYPMPGNLTPRF